MWFGDIWSWPRAWEFKIMSKYKNKDNGVIKDSDVLDEECKVILVLQKNKEWRSSIMNISAYCSLGVFFGLKSFKTFCFLDKTETGIFCHHFSSSNLSVCVVGKNCWKKCEPGNQYQTNIFTIKKNTPKGLKSQKKLGKYSRSFRQNTHKPFGKYSTEIRFPEAKSLFPTMIVG